MLSGEQAIFNTGKSQDLPKAQHQVQKRIASKKIVLEFRDSSGAVRGRDDSNKNNQRDSNKTSMIRRCIILIKDIQMLFINW